MSLTMCTSNGSQAEISTLFPIESRYLACCDLMIKIMNSWKIICNCKNIYDARYNEIITDDPVLIEPDDVTSCKIHIIFYFFPWLKKWYANEN